jgi:phosphatidylserine decarboxylase
MTKKIVLTFLPKQLLSITFGKLANCKIVWIKNILIRWFVKNYQPDMTFTAEQNPYSYATFNDFFIRGLKPEKQLQINHYSVLSPVSGTICQFGKIDNGKIIQAKGHFFSLEELLTPHFQDYFSTFTDGDFINLYLSPADYHRVHMPIDGKLVKAIYMPGNLFPVNCWAAENIQNLFSRNERLIMLFDGDNGPFIMIMVGAMMVSGISTKFSGLIKTNQAIQEFDYQTQLINYAQGEEIGHFRFGSTVIAIFPKDMIFWFAGLTVGDKIQIGEQICNLYLCP